MNNQNLCLVESKTWYDGHFRPEAKAFSEKHSEHLTYTTAVIIGRDIHQSPLARATSRRFKEVYRPKLGAKWLESDVLALFGVLQHRDEHHRDLTVWLAFALEKRPPREIGHMTIIVPDVVLPSNLSKLWDLERDPRTLQGSDQHDKYPLQRILAKAVEAYDHSKPKEAKMENLEWGIRFQIIRGPFKRNLLELDPSTADLPPPSRTQLVAHDAHKPTGSASHSGRSSKSLVNQAQRSGRESPRDEHSMSNPSSSEHKRVGHMGTKQLSSHEGRPQPGHNLAHVLQGAQRQPIEPALHNHNHKRHVVFDQDSHGENSVKKPIQKFVKYFLEGYPNFDIAKRKLFFAAQDPIIRTPISPADDYPTETYGSRLIRLQDGNLVFGIYRLVHETHDDITPETLPHFDTVPYWGSLTYFVYQEGEADLSVCLFYVEPREERRGNNAGHHHDHDHGDGDGDGDHGDDKNHIDVSSTLQASMSRLRLGDKTATQKLSDNTMKPKEPPSRSDHDYTDHDDLTHSLLARVTTLRLKTGPETQKITDDLANRHKWSRERMNDPGDPRSTPFETYGLGCLVTMIKASPEKIATTVTYKFPKRGPGSFFAEQLAAHNNATLHEWAGPVVQKSTADSRT